MQPFAAAALLLVSFGLGIWAAFWVNKRLLNVPFFIRFFVGIMIFVAVSGALGFIAQLAVYGGTSTTRDVSDQHYINNFKTIVATASQDHYTPYWLGSGFEAGGLRFRGPFTGDFGDEVDGGGVSTDYNAANGSSLTITSYSPAAWAQSPQNTRAQAAATAVVVTAGAYDAKLVRVPLRGRPNLLEVVFKFDETVVLATTFVDASHPDATPNPNPLVDEATLLSVLAQLRAYPQ